MDGLRKAADDRGMSFWRHARLSRNIENSCGGLPLAAVSTTQDIEQSVHEKGFTCYTSHGADPLPAHVGLAVLNTIQNEKLIEAAQRKGGYLRAALEDLMQRHEHIGDVRGLGLLLGIELSRTGKARNRIMNWVLCRQSAVLNSDCR